MLSCEEVEELLPAYALRALSDDERRAVDEHLATCARHADLASYREVASALALSGEEREPPAGLLDRIREQVAASSTPPAVRNEPIAIAPRRGTPRWMPLAAMAAALLLVSAGLWRSGFVNVGGDPVIERVATSGAVEGRLAYRAGAQTSEFTVRGLQPPPTGHGYQAWVIRPGQTPEPFGVLQDAGDHRRVTISTPLNPGDAVALTVEPTPGSPAPTTAAGVRTLVLIHLD